MWNLPPCLITIPSSTGSTLRTDGFSVKNQVGIESEIGRAATGVGA